MEDDPLEFIKELLKSKKLEMLPYSTVAQTSIMFIKHKDHVAPYKVVVTTADVREINILRDEIDYETEMMKQNTEELIQLNKDLQEAGRRVIKKIRATKKLKLPKDITIDKLLEMNGGCDEDQR